MRQILTGNRRVGREVCDFFKDFFMKDQVVVRKKRDYVGKSKEIVARPGVGEVFDFF